MYDKTANPRSTLTTTVNKGKNQRNFPLLVKMEGCFSVETAGSSLISLGAVLFAIVLAQATLSSGRPTEQLGERPHGTNVVVWFVNALRHNVGTKGYDPILGALHPGLRLLAHASAMLVLWGVACLVVPTSSSSASCQFLLFWETESSVTHLGCVIVGLYVLWSILFTFFLPGVSMPGGPRPHKIQRQPKWDNINSKLDPEVVSKWRCAVAQDSHAVTYNQFGADLSGEPAGRQMWTTEPVTDRSTPSSSDAPASPGRNFISKVVGTLASPGRKHQQAQDEEALEKEIRDMASGGRGGGKDAKDYSTFNPSKNPNSCDQIFRAQQIRNYVRKGGSLPNKEKPKTVRDATRKAVHFYSMLQCEDGHWAADYGGPHFLMPGMITAWYILGKPAQMINDEQAELMKHYIFVHQQSDGGWGTHIESPSTMFGSTLMYVALRLLGVEEDHSACVKGRKFLKQNGGALYTSSWSKFYLCLLGCMDWAGHNSVPPEMWMLPNWFPFHPGRMWCHARMVYLPMGYLYGNRFVYENADSDQMILSLRKELYCEDYNTINWIHTRHLIADTDNYSPIPWVMKTLQNILARYESWAIFQPFKNYVRKFGLDFSLEYMKAEDLQTNFIDIGPVNKVMNLLSMYHAYGGDLDNSLVVNHMMRVQDYLWLAEDGMKMQGYNGSQLWDTSFCIQAIYESELADEFPEVSGKVWKYLERTQILSTEVSRGSPAYEYESGENRNKFYRHISEGGWPFSTSAHGWPISDCTSEGLKAAICLLKTNTIKEGIANNSLKDISEERLQKAINVLLTYQNEDGGWATYENNRGWGWYEQLNPSEVFGDIMIDYSYVECSMAVLTSLADFREMFPEHRPVDIQHSIDKGRAFLKSIQRDDGSWYGSWACCFCYGVWFGVEGLVRCGEPLDSPCIQKACDYLLKHQRPNGGWGEDFTSCYDKDYAKEGMVAYGDEGSGVVNTAWALLALSVAKSKDVPAIQRGVQYLVSRQLPCGDWPQEGIAGVFNRSVGITYTAYRNVFPIWALGRCSEVYGDLVDEDK